MTSRRIRANRRRWSQPVTVLRATKPLSPETAHLLISRFTEAQRRRVPLLVTPEFEVYR